MWSFESHTADVEYISSMQSCDYPISVIIKCTFKCKTSLKMNSPCSLTGINHKRGRLRELYINGHTVLDTRVEQINWLDDAPCTRQLDNGEDRPEGKQNSWLYDITWNLYKATGWQREQTRGQTRQLAKWRMYPSQEPQLASDMRHHVCLVQELGGLWIVESLATSGLYGIILFLLFKTS